MKKETKAQYFYRLATEAFENYILNRDSFQGRYICPVTNNTYHRKDVKVSYLYSPIDAPRIAFNEANAFVEYKSAKDNDERLYSIKLNIAFKHGNGVLTKLLKGEKKKNWNLGRSVKELNDIIKKYSMREI